MRTNKIEILTECRPSVGWVLKGIYGQVSMETFDQHSIDILIDTQPTLSLR